MEVIEVELRRFVEEVGHVINAAQDVANVISPLRYLASLLRESDGQGTSIDTKWGSRIYLQALDEIATVCREKALEAFPETASERVLSRAFYRRTCFPALAQLLLQKVSADWLACFSSLEQSILFDDFFTRAPLHDALPVLVHGLHSEQVLEDEEAYLAVDGLSSASAQAQRQGVKKLALSFSSTDIVQEAGLRTRGVMSNYGQKSLQLAQLLSSIPDRANLQTPSALQFPFYAQSVVSQLLDAAEEHWIFLSTHDSLAQLSSSDETIKFMGEVIGRLCRRGHADVFASQMASRLWQRLLTSGASSGVELDENQYSSSFLLEVIENLQMSIWPSLAASITDSYALERFTESLLKEMATKAILTDGQAYCILHSLYGNIIKERAATRTLFTEKFLFWKVLPFRCLKWVLDFAILCSPPTSGHWVQVGRDKSTIQKYSVRRLAETWATKDFIQSAPVQQQAYLTAALGMCLGAMNKDALEDMDGLVSSLLKGVSNRLDSPLSPVRQMAKRIALAFSTIVDPGKPLLFDEEDKIEDLLNWIGLEQGGNWNLNISESERNQIPTKADKELDTESKGALGHKDDKDQKQEKRRRRKEKKEKLTLEEDDPDAIVRFGEGSTDEESEQSSESESDSASSLHPYNMSDDDSDVGKEKFVTQLADLATNLRKGDNPDAVEVALEVAEKLVLAMPEELDNLAADLTHALVHVKCSVVAVEGEEDIAEQRRQRALVALLFCSPLQSVSVLTTELFSRHVDASQRILILDVMAAGARALASGIRGEKSSDEDRRSRLLTNVPETIESNSWYLPGSGHGRTGAGPWVEVFSPVPGGTLVGWAHSYERELPLRQGQRPLGRSRRWAQRAMQLRDERIRNPSQTQKNGFAHLAAAFMLPVMRDYDKRRQGLEILGRDFLVLGGILSMLGVCMECIAMHQEAAVLGTGLLEMLRSREISSHSEVFVRRTALFAASRVLASLHPSHVVASLSTGVSSTVANLEWVREWALDIAINDVDTDCSMMATVCVQLHSEMALQVQRAMGSLELPVQTLEAKIQSSPSIIMPF